MIWLSLVEGNSRDDNQDDQVPAISDGIFRHNKKEVGFIVRSSNGFHLPMEVNPLLGSRNQREQIIGLTYAAPALAIIVN